MTLRAHIRPAAKQPLGALVLLHGRGADEHDLTGFGDGLDPMARLVLATPRAPLSEGMGALWYRLVRMGYPEESSFTAARQELAAWLDDFLQEQGLDHAHTILGGFCQGAVMALGYALGSEAPPVAGVLALSGYVPQAEGFPVDESRLQGLPVFVNHGEFDRLIPVQWGRQVRDSLTAAGAAVSYREFKGEHLIDGEGMRQARLWLNQRVADWAAGT